VLADVTTPVTSWLTAVGTVGAVIVALWLAWRGDRRAEARRPQLSVAFDDTTGLVNEKTTYRRTEAIITTGSPVPVEVVLGQGLAAYLRIEVNNDAGHDAAEDVEVLLSRVFTMTPDTKELEVVDISFPGFPWTHVGATRLTIPAGVKRTIDVARVHDDPPDKGMAGVLELLVEPTPGDFRNHLKTGAYELHLTVSARNADASHYVARVRFDPSRARRGVPSTAVTMLGELELRTVRV
jgi:hypothetical protein